MNELIERMNEMEDWEVLSAINEWIKPKVESRELDYIAAPGDVSGDHTPERMIGVYMVLRG